jgi:GH24 family phage-related lysozyme (muramidase)
LKKNILLKNRIKKNEGYKSSAYFDQLGFPTIGYGHLIKTNEKIFFTQKFSKKFLLNLFNLDFYEAATQYEKHYHKYNFSNNIREVLIEMIFQIGINGQRKFLKMNEHLKNNHIFMASLEMINSLWYSQTPKRVDDLINILLKRHNEKKTK